MGMVRERERVGRVRERHRSGYIIMKGEEEGKGEEEWVLRVRRGSGWQGE